MISNLGIGIDVVKINRFRNIPYEKNKRFYKKIFVPSEITYCIKFKDPERHFAGKFAIKEAVKKSISQKINMTDIETSHSKSKPAVRIKNNKKYHFLASISHEDEIALGVVISEKFFN